MTRRPIDAGKAHLAVIVVLAYVVLIDWGLVLKPEVSGDGLAMHLAIPAAVANAGRWGFDAAHLTYAVMPMGGDWCYTAVYLVGGEFAARLLNFAFHLIVAVMVFQLARRWLSSAGATLMAALWIANPIAQLVTTSLFVDNAWAMMTTAAFVSLMGPASIATPILLGSTLAVKFGSIAFVPVVAGAAWIAGVRTTYRRLIGAIVLFLVFAAPPYLTAYVKTGNPIFPFANQVFHSPYFEPTAFEDVRFHERLSWKTLFDVTVRTSKYFEGQDGGFGFLLLLLLPAAALAILIGRVDGRRTAATCLIVAACFWVLTFLAAANVRYLHPVIPLLLAVIASFWGTAEYQMRVATSLIACTALGLNIWFLPSSSWYHKDFVLLTKAERAAYLTRSAPVRRLVEYMNEKHGGKPVLFLDNDQFAGIQAPFWSNTWRHRTFAKKWTGNEGALDELVLARSIGVEYFIAPVLDLGGGIAAIGTRRFLASCTEPEFRDGSYYVARLAPSFAKGDPHRFLEQFALEPGTYDDTHPSIRYEGKWVTDQQFREPTNGTVSYSNIPGAYFAVEFDGTAISWMFTKALNRGIAVVYIDDKPVRTVDLYSLQTEWRSQITIDGLPASKHVLKVVIAAAKSPAATDRYIDIDGLEVRSTQVR